MDILLIIIIIILIIKNHEPEVDLEDLFEEDNGEDLI